MAAFDLTAADPLMKIHFNPRIIKQFNTAAVLYNRMFEGKGIPISNRGLEIPLHVGPNADFTWYADGGTLPQGSGQRLTRSSVGFQSFALAVQFTGATLDAVGDDAVTYARALTFNVKNATVDAIKYLNIYSFLDGTGILAKVGAGKTLSTTADNTAIRADGNVDNARYLRVGMTVDFMTGVTTPVRATATIKRIDTPPAVAVGPPTPVTFDTGPATVAATLVTGDGIVVTGSFNRVLTGLAAIVDDGTVAPVFQNIVRSSFPEFKGNLISLTGSPALSRDHLRRSIALIQIVRGSVNTGDLELWAHPAQLHSYADMGWTLKRYLNNMKKLDLGYTAYEWEGIPWVIDTDAPKDTIYLLDSESLLKVTARNLSFDDRTGAILRQVPSATSGRYNDAFVAFLLARFNLGAYSPNSNTKISGLGVPTGY